MSLRNMSDQARMAVRAAGVSRESPFEFASGRIREITHAHARALLRILDYVAAQPAPHALSERCPCPFCLARRVRYDLADRRRRRTWRARESVNAASRERAKVRPRVRGKWAA